MIKVIKFIANLLFILIFNPFTLTAVGITILIYTLGWLPTLGILLLFVAHNGFIYEYLRKTVNYHLTSKIQKHEKLN